MGRCGFAHPMSAPFLCHSVYLPQEALSGLIAPILYTTTKDTTCKARDEPGGRAGQAEGIIPMSRDIAFLAQG